MAGTFAINTVAHPTVGAFVTTDSRGREVKVIAGTPVIEPDAARRAILRTAKRNGVLVMTEA